MNTSKDPQPFMTSSRNRLERALGWILLLVGALILGGYGLYQWLSTIFGNFSEAPLTFTGILLAYLGLAILLLSVIREQFFFHKKERYKNIEQ